MSSSKAQNNLECIYAYGHVCTSSDFGRSLSCSRSTNDWESDSSQSSDAEDDDDYDDDDDDDCEQSWSADHICGERNNIHQILSDICCPAIPCLSSCCFWKRPCTRWYPGQQPIKFCTRWYLGVLQQQQQRSWKGPFRSLLSVCVCR